MTVNGPRIRNSSIRQPLFGERYQPTADIAKFACVQALLRDFCAPLRGFCRPRAQSLPNRSDEIQERCAVRTDHPRNRPRLALTLALGVLVCAAATPVGAAAAGAARSSSARPSAAQVIRITTHGFDWGNAGIGAAAGIGLSMLAVGASLLLASARQDIASARRPTTKEQR
jgi:hypothetical protein